MERCYYCNVGGVSRKTINHAEGCPEVEPLKKFLYREGWDDGWGAKLEASEDPTYQMGYVRGCAAAEGAENGHNPYW